MPAVSTYLVDQQPPERLQHLTDRWGDSLRVKGGPLPPPTSSYATMPRRILPQNAAAAHVQVPVVPSLPGVGSNLRDGPPIFGQPESRRGGPTGAHQAFVQSLGECCFP